MFSLVRSLGLSTAPAPVFMRMMRRPSVTVINSIVFLLSLVLFLFSLYILSSQHALLGCMLFDERSSQSQHLPVCLLGRPNKHDAVLIAPSAGECGDDWNLYVHKRKLHKVDLTGKMGRYVKNALHYLKVITVVGHKEVIKCGRVNSAVTNVNEQVIIKKDIGESTDTPANEIVRTSYKLYSCFEDTTKLAWNMTDGYIKHIYHYFNFGKAYSGDGMPFLCRVKGVVYYFDEHDPLCFELKSRDSLDEDEVIFLPVAQPSSSSVLNRSPTQLGKGVNDYSIGFLVLLGFVIIVGVLHYRWWKNRVQPNRQPCELNEQRKGKNHSKHKKTKNRKNKNNDSSSQWENMTSGSTSQGHIQLEGEEECFPELLLERDNYSTSQLKNKNNGSTNQGHIQLEDEEYIPELSFKEDGIWFSFDLIEEFKSKMLIEEFLLTYCTTQQGHILEEDQIKKLLLKGNVKRPPFDLLKDYQEGNGCFIGKLFVSKIEIARGRNRTIIFEGMYNNVHVAIKRLVHRRNYVGLEYLRELIELVQHPNIVHAIDIVMDDVFIYFALERCSYNLYEFSQLCSNSRKRDNPQDRSIMQIVQKLWQPNGYPSPMLVKLIRDVVSGVAHLHAFECENLDLRPQHVLLSFEKSPCAKICNQLIVKGFGKLARHRRPGWHSLEPLLGAYKFFAHHTRLPARMGRGVDLFNLGCVIFFFITKGCHPFGPVRKRDANIEINYPDLALVEHIYDAAHLISILLHPDPDMRPEAKDVLGHPFFWDSEKRGLFLRDVSAWLEHEDGEKNYFVNAMINAAPKVLDGKWDVKLDASFLTFATSDKCYSYDSVLDLLLLIGNILRHQQWLPKDIQVLIGSTHGEIYDYFASLFPRLFNEVYVVATEDRFETILFILAKYC